MNVRSFTLVFLLLIVTVPFKAQALSEKTLINIEGRQISAGEFIRMFRKSSEFAEKQNMDDYLAQYVIFQLKVTDAVRNGIDTTRSFKNELKGYRDQLAVNYLTDQNTRESILKKTYQRSLTEINAWHILVSCKSDANPKDTLIAWQKASDIRKRILNGELFENVARATSDDPSVMNNGGNLGYFTVFQMISPFEDAAYNMKKGEISEPVRSSFGYHIIKVTDKRSSRGKVLVAHIMKASPPGTDEKTAKEAEESINNIYRELLSGNDFASLAKKYSDHRESASNGGKLNWFGTGEIVSDFNEAAFSIKDTGSYSMPVRTLYGWHIIKLLDRRPHGTFEETRSFLESRINQSYLNSLSRKALVERLKKEYRYTLNQVTLNWFIENTDTAIIQGINRYNRTEIPPGNIYTFANQHLTTREFAGILEKKAKMIITEFPSEFIIQALDEKVSDHIISYENSMLEKKYPDFRYLVNEFHDGILMFEISGDKIWNRALKDSAGLKSYYEEHKFDHLTKKGIEASIYSLRSAKGEKELRSAYEKYSKKPDKNELLQKKFNRKNDSLLVITDGMWYVGDSNELDEIEWSQGTHFCIYNDLPSVVEIKRILEPVPLDFSKVEGEMATGYQEYLENQWIKQLKEKYTVKIDNLVLEEITKELGL